MSRIQNQSKEEQPLCDKESSNGIRSAAGQPVLCLHSGEAVLTDEYVRDHLINYICDEFVAVFCLLTDVKERPELISRLYASGHCLGMLEPRTNIIVNLILHSGLKMDDKQSEWHMSESIRLSCLERQYWMTPANESLDGLVVFLMAYFRYLSKPQALRYLFLARCDLVLAIGLVESDLLNRKQFTFGDETSMMTRAFDALHLATVAANHPYADKVANFAVRCFRPDDAQRFSCIMGAGTSITDKYIRTIRDLLQPQKEEPKVTAAGLRHERFSPALARTLLPDALNQMSNVLTKELCDYSATVKRILLDALYAFYMKAFDCLSLDMFYALQTAILRSGLCFGPFGDPVENILLNAIWFKAAFPELSPELRQHLVHSERISMLCRVSLDANIHFLCRKYMMLSSHDAILLIYRALFDRSSADDFAARKGHSRETDDHNATVHALRAAGLPQCGPHMASYHSTIRPEAKARAKDLLCKHHHSRFLSQYDVDAISVALEISSPRLPPSRVPELSDKASSILTTIRKDFKHKERRIKRKLSRMLETKYMTSDSVVEAESRKKMKGGVEILCIVGGQRFFSYCKPFFHVNVLARDAVKGTHKYDLFFAQLSESREFDPEFDFFVDLEWTCRAKSAKLSFQIPVWSKVITAARCLPCEGAATKVIHPFGHKYLGKEDKNFADSLDDIYGACEGDGDTVFESQCVYFDVHNDGELVDQLERLDDELDFLPSD